MTELERLRMLRTSQSYIGIAPAVAPQGDLVYMYKSCRTPIMLRTTGEDDELILVCDCYSHDFTKGDQFEFEGVSMFGYRRSGLD
jgi:hypothetical protein